MEKLKYCNCCNGTEFVTCFEQPDFLYFPEDIFIVQKCLDCGLAFVNPRPEVNKMGKYYPSDFFGYFSNYDHTKRYKEEARYIQKFAGRNMDSLKILDIGCANGDFPRFLQKEYGASVVGLEISQNAKYITDFPCYRVPFPDAPIAKSSFDIITAWAVLEHVHDPMAYFAKAASSLKPGGYFIFLVNNFESIASRFLYCEDIPRHLFFFSKSTVKLYAKKNGFYVKDIRFNNKIYSLYSRYWLIWLLRKIFRKDFKYDHITKLNALKFKAVNKPELIAKISFAIRHPIYCTDYLLTPIFDKLMMLIGYYGVMICALKKR